MPGDTDARGVEAAGGDGRARDEEIVAPLRRRPPRPSPSVVEQLRAEAGLRAERLSVICAALRGLVGAAEDAGEDALATHISMALTHAVRLRLGVAR